MGYGVVDFVVNLDDKGCVVIKIKTNTPTDKILTMRQIWQKHGQISLYAKSGIQRLHKTNRDRAKDVRSISPYNCLVEITDFNGVVWKGKSYDMEDEEILYVQLRGKFD